MPADLTYAPTRPPIVAPAPSSDDPLTILRTYSRTVTPMGEAGIKSALQGERATVVLERVARVDGARLGVVTQ